MTPEITTEKDDVSKLYNALVHDDVYKDVMPQTEDQFRADMEDPGERKKIYDTLRKDEVYGDLVTGSNEELDMAFGFKKKASTISSENGSPTPGTEESSGPFKLDRSEILNPETPAGRDNTSTTNLIENASTELAAPVTPVTGEKQPFDETVKGVRNEAEKQHRQEVAMQRYRDMLQKQHLNRAETYLRTYPQNLLYATEADRKKERDDLLMSGISEETADEAIRKRDNYELDKLAHGQYQELAQQYKGTTGKQEGEAADQEVDKKVKSEILQLSYQAMSEEEKSLFAMNEQYEQLREANYKNPDPAKLQEAANLRIAMNQLSGNSTEFYDPVSKSFKKDPTPAFEEKVQGLQQLDKDKLGEVYNNRALRFMALDKQALDAQKELAQYNTSAQLSGSGSESEYNALKANVDRIQNIRDEAYGEFQATIKAYLLNQSVSGTPRSNPILYGAQGFLANQLPSFANKNFLYKTNRAYTEFAQKTFSNEPGFLNKADRERFKQSFPEMVSDMTFQSIPVVAQLAVANKIGGALEAASGLAKGLEILRKGSTVDRVYAGVMESIVQEMVQAPTGITPGTPTAFVLSEKLKAPKLKGKFAALQPLFDMAVKATGATAAMEGAGGFEKAAKAISQDKSIGEIYKKEGFEDLSDHGKRVLSEYILGLMFGLPGMMKKENVTFNPQKLYSLADELRTKGQRERAIDVEQKAAEMEGAYVDFEETKNEPEANTFRQQAQRAKDQQADFNRQAGEREFRGEDAGDLKTKSEEFGKQAEEFTKQAEKLDKDNGIENAEHLPPIDLNDYIYEVDGTSVSPDSFVKMFNDPDFREKVEHGEVPVNITERFRPNFEVTGYTHDDIVDRANETAYQQENPLEGTAAEKETEQKKITEGPVVTEGAPPTPKGEPGTPGEEAPPVTKAPPVEVNLKQGDKFIYEGQDAEITAVKNIGAVKRYQVKTADGNVFYTDKNKLAGELAKQEQYATDKRNIESGNQQEHQGNDGQLSPEGEHRDEPPIGQQEGAETGDSHRNVESPDEKIIKAYSEAPKHYGHIITRTLPDGTKIKGRYVLTVQGAATPSHHPETFASSEGFPVNKEGKNINDRNYERDKNAQAMVKQYGDQYDSRALDNVPAITSHGVVVDGNNRVMSGAIAAKQGTDTKYLNALEAERLPVFGFTPEQYEEVMKKGTPRVYFEIENELPYTTETMGKFNREEKKSKAPVDVAIELGRTVKEHTQNKIISLFEPFETLSQFNGSPKAVRDLQSVLVNDGVIDENRIAGFFQDGAMTDAGQEFVESLLIGKVINEDQLRQLQKPGIKSLRANLFYAIGPILENSRSGDYSLIGSINKAIDLENTVREAGTNLASYIGQLSMFDAQDLDPVAVLANIFLKLGPRQFKAFIKDYNADALSAAGGQVNIFEGRVLEPTELLLSLINKYESKLDKSERDALRKISGEFPDHPGENGPDIKEPPQKPNTGRAEGTGGIQEQTPADRKDEVKPPAPPAPPNERKPEVEDKELDDLWGDFEDNPLGFNARENSPVSGSSKIVTVEQLEKGIKLVERYASLKIYDFEKIINDAYARLGDQKLKQYYEAIKKAYGSFAVSATEDVADLLTPLKEVRNFDVDIFIENKKPALVIPKTLQGTIALAERLANEIEGGVNFTNRTQFEKLGKEFGVDPREAMEAVELALVNLARKIALRNDLTQEQKFEQVKELYKRQPSLLVRTSESIEKAQFSTPAPYAFSANVFTDTINNPDAKVFDPTGGNGMLVFTSHPSNINANEIDPVRFKHLQSQLINAYNLDVLEHAFPQIKNQTALLLNPPFGKYDTTVDGYKLNRLEQAIVVNALTQQMATNGRAAIIIGGHNEYQDNGRLAGGDLPFFNWLYHNYHVLDVINVDGSLFAKQGTKFPTRMILVAGKKAVPSGATPLQDLDKSKIVTTFDELYQRAISAKHEADLLQPGLDANVHGNNVIVGGNGQGINVSGSAGTPPTETPDKPDKGIQGGGKPPGSGSGGKVERPAAGGTGGSGRAGISPPADKPISDGTEPGEGAGTGKPKEGAVQQGGGGGSVRGNNLPDDSGISADDIISAEGAVPYKPFSQAPILNVSIPAGMVFPMRAALEDFVKRNGPVDEYVQDKLQYPTKEKLYHALKAEQIDAVAMAIDNIERGQGVVIGDMTGIGKGRIAAALIRYGSMHNEQPIFFTEKAELFSDILRDLIGIGSGNLKPLIINADAKADMTDENGKVIHKRPGEKDLRDIINSGKVPKDYKYVAITYSQINSMKRPAKRMFMRDVAAGSLMIMDESHNASGASNTGAFFMDLLESAKAAVFLSATYAKTPENMPVYAKKTVMSEANLSMENLVEAIKKGGIPLQEVISKELTAAGQMVRRERTFDGVNFHYPVLGAEDPEVKAAHIQAADKVTEVLRDIVEFQRQYVNPVISGFNDDLSGAGGGAEETAGTSDAGASNVPFTSKIYNVGQQLLLALKADQVADMVIKELQKGRKPTVFFMNTMETFLNDMGYKYGERIDNTDFSQTLIRGLNGVMKWTETTPEGEKQPRVLKPFELGPEGEAAYNVLLEKIKSASTGISISPIDRLIYRIQKAGYKVAEITGRASRVQFLDDGTGILEQRKDKDKKMMFRGFNNLNKMTGDPDYDALIFNVSGSTGVSAHSSPDFSDQRPRSMFVMQAHHDINVMIQALGRIFRTGQLNLPEYSFPSSVIPAEMRLSMMLKNKLKSLNANTSSDQKSSQVIQQEDFLNNFGNEVVAQYIAENEDFNLAIFDPFKLAGKPESETEAFVRNPPENTARKVTGYVALLPAAEQNHFYDEISQRYSDYIDYLNQSGNNTLEMTSLPLNATTESSQVVVQGSGGRSGFGKDTIMEHAEIDVLKHPYTKDKVYDLIADQLGDDASAQEHKDKMREEMNAFFDNRIKEMNERWRLKTFEEVPLAQRERFMNQLEANREYAKNLILHFVPGIIVNVPIIDGRADVAYSRGAVIGIAINKKAKNPYAPSSMKVRIAVADGRQYLAIPGSRQNVLSAILATTQFEAGSRTETHAQILERWDELTPKKLRTKAYIATGNILQGLGNSDIRNGKLVNYTTSAGKVKTGVLMPDNYLGPGNEKVVNISNAIAELSDTKKMTLMHTSGGMQIERLDPHSLRIEVPLSREKGGKYFLNESLRNLTTDGNFISLSKSMVAYVPNANIGPFVAILSKEPFRETVTVSVPKPPTAKGEKEGLLFPEENNPLPHETENPRSKGTGARMIHDVAPRAGGSGKAFHLNERVKAILEKVGVPVAERGIPKRYLGLYKLRSKKVRVQTLLDIFVAAHEATHGIDHDSGVREKIETDTSFDGQAVRDELEKAYLAFYPGAKPSHKEKLKIVEGLATFFEYYLYDPVTMAKDYPALVKDVLKPGGKFNNPRFNILIDELDSLIKDYSSLTPNQKIGTRIAYDTSEVKGKWNNWYDHLMFQLFNTGQPLKRIDAQGDVRWTDRSAESGFSMKKKSFSIVSNWISGDHPAAIIKKDGLNFDFENVSVHDYAKIFGGDVERFKAFNNYLNARRGLGDFNRMTDAKNDLDDFVANLPDPLNPSTTERIKIIKLTKEYKRWKGIVDKDDFDIQAATHTVAEGDNDKDFQKAVKIFDRINELALNFSQNCGLITPEFADYCRQFKDYASFARYIDDDISTARNTGGMSSQQKVKAFLERTGGALPFLPPVYNQIAHISEVIHKGMENLMWQKVVKLGDSNPVIARLIEERMPTYNPALKMMNEDRDPNILKVSFNGHKKYYMLAPELRAVADSMAPEDFDGFAEILARGSAMFSRMTTSAFPLFPLANIPVDAITRMSNSRTGGISPVGAPTIKELMHGLFRMIGQIEVAGKKMGKKTLTPADMLEFEKFLALGAKSSTFSASMKNPSEALAEAMRVGLSPFGKLKQLVHGKNAGKNIGDIAEAGLSLMELPTNLSEYLFRFDEFRRAKKQGDSDTLAMFKAAQVTIPFENRGNMFGQTGRAVVRGISYMGAGMNVFNKYFDAWGDNPLRMAVVHAAVAMGAWMVMAWILKNATDDEMRTLAAQTPEDLSRYLYVPRRAVGGTEGFIKLRIPEQLGGMIVAPIYLYGMQQYKIDKPKAKELFRAFATFLPQQMQFMHPKQMAMSYVPTAIRPGMEAFIFEERTYPEVAPIVPWYLENYPDSMQYDKYTTDVARTIGNMTGESPMLVDHWLYNQFGRTPQLFISKRSTKNPIMVNEQDFLLRGYDMNTFYDKAKLYQMALTVVRHKSDQKATEAAYADNAAYEYMRNAIGKVRKYSLEKEVPEEIKNELWVTIQKLNATDHPGKLQDAVNKFYEKVNGLK